MFDKLLQYLIYLYIIILPLTPSKFKVGPVPFNGDVILAVVILMYLVKAAVNRNSRKAFLEGLKDFFTSSLGIFMALLILAMGASVLYSMDKKMAINETARFVTYIILFFIIKYDIKDKNALRNMLRIYFAVCFVIFSKGIFDFGTALMRVGNMEYFNQLRTVSTLENANNLATFAIISLFPAITLFLGQKRWIYKAIYGLLTMMALANIVVSYSRSALLGVALGCILLALLYSYKFIFAFILMGGAAVMIPATRIRLLQIADMTQNVSRIKVWKTSLYMIKDHLLLGVGNGNFYTLYGSYVEKHPELVNTYDAVQVYHPHNIFLKIQCELGILGTISFAGVIISIFRNLIRFIKNEEEPFFYNFYRGFLISAVVFIAMNLIDNFFSAPKVIAFFWIFTAVFESLANGRKRYRWKGVL